MSSFLFKKKGFLSNKKINFNRESSKVGDGQEMESKGKRKILKKITGESVQCIEHCLGRVGRRMPPKPSLYP